MKEILNNSPIESFSGIHELDCITMEDWVEAVRMQGDPADVYPVCVPPDIPRTKYADSVEEQIKVLRDYIA